MILDKQDDLQAFRKAVVTWLADVLPVADAHGRGTAQENGVAFQKWWMAEKNKVGLATPHWPKEFGGADLSLAHQIIISDEFARADAPFAGLFLVALNHIPTTLIAFGTDEQRARHLPGVAKGTIWCQGFSEPNAGSDLASLRTRAVRDGDHYVINGQKIWSSMAMDADYCILLTRTSTEGKKQQGITYFLLDMKTPGVEVRPIKQSNTRSHFGEMFLTDVRIPVENRVGEENQGWTVAQATLSAERGILAFELLERRWYAVLRFYRAAVKADAAWLQDDELRRQFVTLFAKMQAIRRQVRQVLKENVEGHQPGSLTPAFVKISYTTVYQDMAELMTRIGGLDGQTFHNPDDRVESGMLTYLESYGLTISAGSNEVMRNLIAERGLGLPRG